MSNEVLKLALGRRLDGQKLSRRDERELARHDKAEAERLLLAVPRVLVRRLTGLTQGKLESVAQRHEIPIDGATVDMFALFPAILDALEEEETAGGSPSLERLRGIKADLAELELAAKRKEMLPRAEVREGLLRVAAIYKNRGEAWERAFGPTMKQELERLNDEAVAEIKRMFPEARLPDDDE